MKKKNPKTKWKRRIICSLITLIIIFSIGGYIVLNNIAPYAIIMPQKINLAITPGSYNLKSEKLIIQTKDSIELHGYWIESEIEEPRGIIILIHGIGGCKEHFLPLAKDLAKQGIESIVFDGRAHGKSSGQYCTYGYKEKKDITEIVDRIKQKKPNLPIGIWGNSLGGAIAIQALEHDKRIEFGIIESTFADLSQVVYDYKKRMLKGIGLRFASNFALKRAGEIGDFNPEKVKPIESVKNIEQPIFIAHGDADENISYIYGKALFENTKSQKKEFTLIKGGGHFGLFETGGVEYIKKIQAFIDRNL